MYQSTPMPGASIKRQHASLRRSTKKLKAQLGRLATYTDPKYVGRQLLRIYPSNFRLFFYFPRPAWITA